MSAAGPSQGARPLGAGGAQRRSGGETANASAELAPARAVGAHHETMRIAGERVDGARSIEVRNPYTGGLAGTVPKGTVDDVRRAFALARAYRPTLTRYERASICQRTAALIRARALRRRSLALRHPAQPYDARGVPAVCP